MRIEICKSLTKDQRKQINYLWNELYPLKLNNRFELLLKGINEYNHHVLLNEANQVIGWAVDFLRNDEIWFSILVSSSYQKKGYGQMLLNSLKQSSNSLCGWVIDHNNDLKQDGSTYFTPIQFYLKNGFRITNHKIVTDIISAVKIKFETSV